MPVAPGPSWCSLPSGRPALCRLDRPAAITFKQAVQPSPRAPIESLLAELSQREKDLHGQLGELGEEIDELRAQHKPIGQRRITRFDQLREAYWTVKHRLAQLQSQRPDWQPPGVTAPGDF